MAPAVYPALTRREVLRASLVGAGLLIVEACGGSSNVAKASPGAPITFRHGFQVSSSAVLPLIAKAQGYFERESIDYQPYPSSAATGTQIAAVASGSLDAYTTLLSLLVGAWQKGVKVRMLGGLIASPKALAVPVRDKTTPVASGHTVTALGPTLKALNGKTIGAPGGTSGISLELIALAKQAGITPDYHIVETGTGAATLAALKTATVDAVYSGLGSTLPAVVAGYARHVMTSSDGPTGYGRSQIVGEMASQAFLDAHPDFAERHQRAITQAAKFFNDKNKRQQVLKVLSDNNIAFVGVDGSQYLDQTPVFPTISKAVVSAALQFIFEAGIDPSSPKATPTDIFAPPALDNG